MYELWTKVQANYGAFADSGFGRRRQSFSLTEATYRYQGEHRILFRKQPPPPPGKAPRGVFWIWNFWGPQGGWFYHWRRRGGGGVVMLTW